MKPKLLIVELWGLGDLVIATPFIQAAAEKFDVTVLGQSYAQDMQKRFWPGVTVVPFTAPWTAFRFNRKYRLWQWPWREFHRLRKSLKGRFDVGLSARWDPRDHVLLASVGAKVRMGFPRAGSRLFLNKPIPHLPKGAHRYEQWRRLAGELGISLPERKLLRTPAVRKGRILIHTGAAQHVRVWPLERFRTLASKLRAEGFAVQVACDPNQREWWIAMGETGVVTPHIVTDLVDLTDRAAAFIGNDSGPGHVAAFNGVPTFTIFGPQLPQLFAPLHQASVWVEGQPCPYRPCSDYCRFSVPHCLWDLSEAAVWPRVHEFILRHADRIERIPTPPALPISLPLNESKVTEETAPADQNRHEPLNTLHINNSADIYGASRNLFRFLKHVDRRRIQPLVVLPEDGLLKHLFEAEGIEVVLHPGLSAIDRRTFHSWRILLFFLNYPLSVFFLWRLIRRRKIALVHTNTGVMVSPALAAWLARVPHVWHIRDWFQEFRRIWPLYSWYIRRFSRKVIAVSNAIADQFEPRSDTMVVHDGLSLHEFNVPKEKLRTEFRARYGLGDAFVVGCVGRIKLVRKGQEILVQATALLKKRGRPVKALIVGAPFQGNEAHLEQIQTMARELGVNEDIVFTGELPDSREAYAALDVLALTSAQPEPFGTVVMEAMAMGVPVIATNIGGCLDQVVEGETGFLVPPADPAALADAIEKLIVDSDLRRKMGAAAIERIQTRFSLVEMTRDLEQFFEDTVAGKQDRKAGPTH